MNKPKAFIGSSRETIVLANAIHSQISYYAQVTPWYAGTFDGNYYTLESLEKQLDTNDFGIFILAADDVALHRGKYVFITRDNTLFEMGLFWGRLRRKRVFAIIPEKVKERDDLIKEEHIKNFHLLSDLQGLTLLKYEFRDDDNHEAAVSRASQDIIKAIQAQGNYIDPCDELKKLELEVQRKRRILHFFWAYNKNITVLDDKERYTSLSEAIQKSIIPPQDFIVTGAALWKKQDSTGIAQVGGNVGKGKIFSFNENQSRVAAGLQPINVLDAYLNSKWSFYNRMEVEYVYVLCYPLGKEHVLSVHFSGRKTLEEGQLSMIVDENNELFRTINHLIGGDSE